MNMKLVFSAAVLLGVLGCSHPMEIIGEGDIVSGSGDRDCLLEDARAGHPDCTDNYVIGAYQETYYAQPRPGWAFWHWRNYCTAAAGNECAFNFSGNAVQSAWGAVVPPLQAVFAPAGCTIGNNVEFVPGFDWMDPGPAIRYPLGFEIKSTSFSMPGGLDFAGAMVFVSTTGNSGVSRRVWVSECPGGPPVNDPRCESTGTSITQVRIYAQANPSYCSLSPGSLYYLNVQNLGCVVDRCDVVRELFSNGRF